MVGAACIDGLFLVFALFCATVLSMDGAGEEDFFCAVVPTGFSAVVSAAILCCKGGSMGAFSAWLSPQLSMNITKTHDNNVGRFLSIV